MKKRKGFTLVELLAVIAILAIILLIAVPMILGVIEDAKQESFRNSVRGVFHAAELYHARTNITNGTVQALDMEGEELSGTWEIVEGKTTLTNVTNGTYCVASLKDDQKGSKFTLTKDCTITPPVEEKTEYKEAILNGAIPVLKEDLIPVTIASDGTVKKADLYDEWYNYSNKQWANAVILMDKAQSYNAGDTIPESNIESYFVWIPRYKYKIFDEGNYTGQTELQTGKEQEIEIVFEDKTVTTSTGSHVGEYLTHPAFTAFDVNGLWVGKFELGYKGATTKVEAGKNELDATKVIVKPNTYSWRSNTVKNFFETMYNYNRSLDSHMIKNTEWGAVAYLSHSKYGKNSEVGINNYNGFITGCGDPPGSATSTTCNAYTTTNGLLASTTGNITGIYDMSGGSHEYVSGYRANTYGSSGFDATSITAYNTKYFDLYNGESATTTYQYRLLGDATGEMGPFSRYPSDNGSWYGDYAAFVSSTSPWFHRGGYCGNSSLAGVFNFLRLTGNADSGSSSRLVLAA